MLVLLFSLYSASVHQVLRKIEKKNRNRDEGQKYKRQTELMKTPDITGWLLIILSAGTDPNLST
jgi:hypothetical protein